MFVWGTGKSKAVHIINPTTNRTLCNVENNLQARTLSKFGEYRPRGMRVCSICRQLHPKTEKVKQRTKKKKRVKLSKLFYQTPEWKELRYQAFLKYGNRCYCCGATPKNGVRLQVDHIKPRHKYPNLSLDIDNLQILCCSCNRGKYGYDETDWRDTEIQAIAHFKEI